MSHDGPVLTEPIRIGQFSAFLGDRIDGMDALLDAGVEVLTGDYLAELTMLVLAKNVQRGKPGYAVPFVTQLERYAERIKAGGVKVVTNAGGLDPVGCAEAVREALSRVGVDLTVAVITGDDIRGELPALIAQGHSFEHLEDGKPLPVGPDQVLTANAYLGAWPIVQALELGADIVICPRVTDASLVVGPAAWRFGWRPDDWDRLAGALWAGHAIECGAQVTGGVFSLFHEFGDLGLPSMPIAEIFENGESVITKPAGTDGVVSVDTVKAQLVYEVGNPLYGNPDVFADLTSVEVSPEGQDRVRITGATGVAPGPDAKVSLCYEGGFRNSVTIGLTGARLDEKLTWLSAQVDRAVGGVDQFTKFRRSVIGPVSQHSGNLEESTAWVTYTVRDERRELVSREGFSDPITQLGVSNIPGFYMTGPPQRERLVAVQWPCVVEKALLAPKVIFQGTTTDVPWIDCEGDVKEREVAPDPESGLAAQPASADVTVTLGSIFGTRSGDKGGTANLGVWARDDAGYEWLRDYLHVDALRQMLPELRELVVERYSLPGIRALNFVVHEYLELGVSSCTRIDPQAKGLGEYLGSRRIVVPRDVAAHAENLTPERETQGEMK